MPYVKESLNYSLSFSFVLSLPFKLSLLTLKLLVNQLFLFWVWFSLLFLHLVVPIVELEVGNVGAQELSIHFVCFGC